MSVSAEENTGIALHNPHKTESATVDLVLVTGDEQARKQVSLARISHRLS